MDSSFRKILRPVDGRSTRGIYSRGKANYPGIANAPNAGNISEIAKKRLRMRLRNGNIANRPQRTS